MVSSFNVDHTKLKSGLYISKVQPIGNNRKIITVDIRLFGRDVMENTPVFILQKSAVPGGMYATVSAGFHTLEHYLATGFRSSLYADNIVYVGPMGCQTGFYLVVIDEDNYFTTEDDTWKKEGIDWVISSLLSVREDIEATSIPGGNSKACGNSLLHSIPAAKEIFDHFLSKAVAGELETEYPK